MIGFYSCPLRRKVSSDENEGVAVAGEAYSAEGILGEHDAYRVGKVRGRRISRLPGIMCRDSVDCESYFANYLGIVDIIPLCAGVGDFTRATTKVAHQVM